MAFHLNNLPIKRKLMLVILLTSSFALLLMGSALITYELVTFRRTLAVNMGVLAQIIGSNSTAALAFDDAKSAQEILSALSAERQVKSAAIYDAQGVGFARFPDHLPWTEFPSWTEPNGHRFDQAHLALFQAIEHEGRRLGTIYLQADLREMYSRFMVYGTLLALVGGCSALGAMALSAIFQRRISQPVLELAKVAQAVSERQDYSVRGVKHGEDEIGQLTEAFNGMLTRIGESNAALTASEERLRLAIEGSQTGTWDWNVAAGYMTWDDFMYPLFGRTRAQFDGTLESAMSNIHPEDVARVQEETRRALEQKRDLDIGYRVVHPDGSIRHMASRGRAFYDSEGKPLRMTGVSMDVTASKKTEEDLSKAKEAAEAANAAKDNFLAVLSHELRTPLTPVLATVSMLQQDHSVPAGIQRELEIIRRNIEVEARLIDDLLDVTGIARGKLELNQKVVDVCALLDHAMKNYCAGVAAKKNLRVTMEMAAEETHVLADASRMTQVFWNLLQNACKFTPPAGAIEIRVRNEEPASGSGDRPELVVDIIDNGIGISPENMPRIFDAFEQGERARTRTFGGLGLGLAISRAIIGLHGGTLTAASEGIGRGARLTLRLGTVPASVAPDVTRAGALGPDQPAARPLRILLVEDHADTASQLVRLLRRAQHEVTWASSIAEAQEQLHLDSGNGAGTSFDLLISDLGLPDGSGHVLMREVTLRKSIPGIALSGYGMKEDIENSLAAGFSRHITKPVDWGELKAAIQEIAAQTADLQPGSTLS